MEFNRKVLPFYMSYPLVQNAIGEDTVMRDLDYLQQLYPKDAKYYQKRISEIIDTMDYEGSMIYDEYPDRWQLYGLTESIMSILKREEILSELKASEEKWNWIQDMVQILLCNEIYKRRHSRKKGYLKF